MAIFLSAGHHITGKNSSREDPGAIGVQKRKENEESIRFKNKLLNYLRTNYPTYKVITDEDSETLQAYLSRIKPGSGSVVLEIHFDAFNGKASGATALVSDNAQKLSKEFAKELVDSTSRILRIPNRGVKPESSSGRGRLGLMRKEGIVSLLELCFIDNPIDMEHYDKFHDQLVPIIAEILVRYDDKLT